MKISLKPLDRQVMVITGASSGIGLATALAAAQHGVRLVLAARSTDTLLTTASHIEQAGGAAIAVTADVGQRADVERIAEAAIGGGGALVNVGSELSDISVPLQGMYAASRHAVKGFTDALRVELDADEAPVAVTLVQPTAVDTPFPEHAGNYLSQEPKLPTPMIEAEKVADAILGAATRPVRDVKVGAPAVLDTLVGRLLPGLADLMGQWQMGGQQRDEAPQRPRAGTLHAPSPATAGRVRGRCADNAARTSDAKASNLRPADSA